MSGVSVATLTVDLIGNSAKLNAELRKSTKNSKDWAEQTRKQVNAVGKAMVAMATVGAAALGGIYAQAAKSGDELAKFSDVIAEMPERVTGLHYAAELTGVSMEKVNTSLLGMTKRLGEAVNGTGTAKVYIEQLGLANESFFSKSPADQFADIADAINGLSTQQEKSAAAAALFGRSGVELLNTLALGSEGLAAMQREAESLGITLSRVDLAKMEAANDSFSKAKLVTTGFGKVLATEISPLLEQLANDFVASAKEAGGFGVIATKVVSAVATGIGYAADMARGLHVVWEGLKQVALEYYNLVVQISTALPQLGEKAAAALGLETDQSITKYAEALQKQVDAGREALQQKALEKMPSDAIKEWVADVQKKALAAAESVAKDRAGNIGQVLLAGGELDTKAAKQKAENDQIINLQQEKYRRLNELAMVAEGQTIELENQRYLRQQAELAADIQRLTDRNLLTADIEAAHRQAEEDAATIHAQKLVDIKQQAFEKEQEIASARWGIVKDAAAIGAALLKQDSRGHRLLLAASRAAGLQQSYIALQTAIAKANALGFPANIPAIGEATTIGLGAINSLKGINVSGIAHGGLDNVPKESTYLLDKGERVLSPNQNQDLKNFMAKGGGATVVNIHNYSGQAVEARQNGDQLDIIVGRVKGALVDDVQRGVGISPVFQNTFGLTRKGVA